MKQNVDHHKHFDILKGISGNKIIYPIIIGLLVIVWLLWKEFDPEAISQIQFTPWVAFWLGIAMMMMVFRDLGYIIRIRILTDKQLSWKQSFNVIMLWEFTSAVTPSAIGGTSIAIFYVNNENINMGKSSAIVLATSFLDELYFALLFPILLILIDFHTLFSIGGASANSASVFANELFTIAIIGYTAKILFCSMVFYGLFINPRGLKYLILSIFKLPFLRKWKPNMNKVGDDLINASRELRGKGIIFWIKAFGATIISWTSRYWVVNFMLLAFFTLDQHLLVFARQLIMWIIMLISPTPGGSGFSEYAFSRYLGDFISVAGLIGALALLWRLITYYPYLIIGAFVFPSWVRKKIEQKNKTL